MLNFCTLFDSNYFSYGISLYQSLQKRCPKFHLYIFAFDDLCEQKLKELNLENIIVISLKDFEDEELLKIKSTRSKGEYCWTCTPSIIRYVLQNFDVDHCTYIDADLYFFSDPKPLIEELGEKSVSIIEHRYSHKHDQSKVSGKYCVQFMTFKNNDKGLEVVNWWRDRCIEWCFSKAEDGKFGDQKYLDDWTTRFDSACELQNLGGGVAPWNVEQYNFCEEEGKIYGIEKASQKKFELIFYHFHDFRILNNSEIKLTGKCYQISNDVKKLIYKEYVKEMVKNSQKYLKTEFNLENNLLNKISALFKKKKNNKIKITNFI